MELTELCARLDERLRTDAYAEIDAHANGLQVGPPATEIERAVFAVDAAVATIEEAVALDADLLIAHHGISWGGFDRVIGRQYAQIAPLIEHDIALYASHLPLDGHQQLGNAAGLAEQLGLTDREPFGLVGKQPTGQRGRLPEPTPTDGLEAELTTLETDRVQTLAFGPEPIETVAIVTGSGTDWLEATQRVGVDALITGEGKQQAYHEARERGRTVFLAGHYATETFGVYALSELLDGWGVDTTFISHPTGL